jgi:hypothetical protein
VLAVPVKVLPPYPLEVAMLVAAVAVSSRALSRSRLTLAEQPGVRADHEIGDDVAPHVSPRQEEGNVMA